MSFHGNKKTKTKTKSKKQNKTKKKQNSNKYGQKSAKHNGFCYWENPNHFR